MEIKTRKLSSDARAPMSIDSVVPGYYIYAAHDHTLYNKCSALIRTDIKMEIPKKYVGLITLHSKLAFDYQLSQNNSFAINPQIVYGGSEREIWIILYNHSAHVKHIKKHDIIAQLTLIKAAPLMPVLTLDENGDWRENTL